MFKKNWPTIVGAILFIISIIFLVIGGITQEQISGLLVAVFAGIAAVTGIFTMVMGWINKKSSK